VLLDLNMPGVRGFSGLLLLRAQYPEIPVMIVTAVEDGGIIRRAFELGASGYLHKSVGPADIRRAIETVLSGEVFVPEGMEFPAEDNQSALMRRLATLTPAAGARADDAFRRPDEQADRLRAVDLRGHGEGARVGDPAESSTSTAAPRR
jgi:DNA-binding NarL/FixJ family response regulator